MLHRHEARSQGVGEEICYGENLIKWSIKIQYAVTVGRASGDDGS